MNEDERIADLRHALNNPLAAILGETQLMLQGDAPLDNETRIALQAVEQNALRMREILQHTKPVPASPQRASAEEIR